MKEQVVFRGEAIRVVAYWELLLELFFNLIGGTINEICQGIIVNASKGIIQGLHTLFGSLVSGK